jgi:DNA-binding MarR family transcriptional regulator
MATRAQRRQATQSRIKAMSHPLRAEAFKLIRVKGPISPAAIARELEADTKAVSYHVRKLREFNCIELVDTKVTRSTVEHFYIATEQHMIDTEEWDELVEADSQMAEVLTDEFLQGIVDDYSASRRASVVGLDSEFFIVRHPGNMDPEGVQEVLEASEHYEKAIEEIMVRSARRQGETGTDTVPVSASIVFFKMPKRSAG